MCNNSSESEASSIDVAHQVIFMVVWVCATVLNLLTIIIMGRSVHTRRTWPNILVFTLSFIDLFIIIIGFFPAVLVLFVDHLLLSKNSGLCNFQGIVLNASYLVSFYLVASISLDRYFAICHPFLYNKKVAQTQSFKVKLLGLFAATIMSVLVSLIPFITGSSHVVHYPGTYCLFDWNSSSVTSRLIIAINMFGYTASMIVIIFSTVKICHAAIKMRWKVQSSSGKRSSITSNDLELNFAKLAVVISTIFFACSLPFEICLILAQTKWPLNPNVDYIAIGILMLNAAFDPLLYAAVRKPVRRGYLEIIKWIVYGLSCFVPWLRPKNNFDEVLGLKNTTKSYYKEGDLPKATTEVNRLTVNSSSTKLNHLIDTSSNDVTVDAESVNTIISQSELQEVTMDIEGDNTVMEESAA